jgi:hypothetical protein
MRNFVLQAILISFLLVLPAFGEAYRCVNVEGKQVISNIPCPRESQDVTRKLTEPQQKPLPLGPAPAQAKPDDSRQKLALPQETKLSATPTPTLQYVEKKVNGWKYREAVSIPESKRLQIFCDLDRVQQRTGDAEGAYGIIARKYELPVDAINAIVGEGALLKWWGIGRCG